MNRTILPLLLVCATLLPAGVPLKQAVEAGVAQALTVENTDLDVRAAALALQTARFNRWAVPTVSASYRYSSKTPEIEAGLLAGLTGGRILSGPLAAGPHGTTDFKLTLTQPLYTSGVLTGQIRAARSLETAERALLRARRNEAAGQVKTSYYSYRALRARRDSLRLLIDTLTVHQQTLQAYLKEELIRKSDLLETQIKIDEARAKLTDLDQAVATEAIQFRRLCGYRPEEVEAETGETLSPLETTLTWMRERHPFVRQLRERVRALAAQRTVVRGQFGPQAQAFAEVHAGRPGQNFFGSEWMAYMQAGVAVSMPLFSWHRPRRETAAIDLAAEKLSNQERDFLTEAEKGLRQLYLRLEALAAKVRLYDNLVATAGETAALKESLYRENQLAHSEFLAAQTDLERYRSDRGELDVQIQIVRVAIHTLAGTHWEEP